MGIKAVGKMLKMKQNMQKIMSHAERVMEKVDEEMYLISKSEKNDDKKAEAQHNLAIYLMAELLDSFEEDKEKKAILENFNKIF